MALKEEGEKLHLLGCYLALKLIKSVSVIIGVMINAIWLTVFLLIALGLMLVSRAVSAFLLLHLIIRIEWESEHER